MKTILICRHAKSDWSNLHINDVDRVLNDRGLRDAPMMGKRLAERKSIPELIIASTAKRAAQTALLIAKEINYPLENIKWYDKLYHAPPSIISDVIFETDDTYNHIMIVCHNPGISDFLNQLAGGFMADMPTCAMASFHIDTEHWAQFPLAKKSLDFYDFPKNGM